MSDTKIDLPKVAQMLDAGWQVQVFKGGMGSYVIIARHPSPTRMDRFKDMLDDDGELVTDDFTPEQALTRMAYKVFGEII